MSRRPLLAALSLALLAACAAPPRPRSVIVIGWDGADWQLLDPLMAQGRMPELSALVHEGARGVLRTIHPPLSPIVWTTMMTGRSPLDHRVLDFTRFNPVTRAREPITSAERRVPAVWTIATQAGRSAGVFGMWATFPAEPISGVMVSDRLMSFQNGAQSPTGGIVYPDARSGWAGEALSRAAAAATSTAVEALAPGVARDPRLAEGLRRILIETAVYDELAGSWYDEHHPELTILYVQGTDAVGHLFAPYRPPPMKSVAAADAALWGETADRYYAEVDRRLGAWRRRARERGATLLLVSDHGFHWGEGRPAMASAAAATAGQWHRDEGVYVIAGPGVGPGASPGHGEVAQVAPTILALLGVPADRAMTEPLGGIASAPGVRPDYAASTAASAAGAVQPEAPVSDEAIARLRALGYVGGAEPDRAPDRGDGGTRTAGSFNNEGLILREAGRNREAKAAFLAALQVDPGHAASLWNLAQLLAADGDPEAEAVLQRAVAASSPEAARRLSERARDRLQQGDCRGALADVRTVAKANPSSAVARAAEGLALMCLGEREQAAEALRRSLAIDPNQPDVARALEALR